MDINRNVEFKDIKNFLLDFFQKKIKNEKNVKKYLKLKLFGSVPIFSEEVQKLNEQNNSKEFIEDCINDIKNNILNTTSENDKAFLITSCNSGEGKSWIAINIGVSLAAIDKKVLLIVTDILKETSDSLYGINHGPKLVKKTLTSNLDILTNEAENNNIHTTHKLLKIDDLKKIIDYMKEVYDIIIIDGPSSNIIEDSIILSSVSDSTILVASYGETKVEDIKKLSNSMKKSNGHVEGIIINKCKNNVNKHLKVKNDVKSDDSKIINKQSIKNKKRIKEHNKMYLRLQIKRQNKHIAKLEKIILQLNKIAGNNLKIENAVNEQNENFKKELENNNEELKRIIAEEIIKMQENMKEEIKLEVISTQEKINNTKAKIQKETQEKLEKIRNDIEADTKKKIEKIKEETDKEIAYVHKQIKTETREEIGKINEDKEEKLNEIKDTIYEEIEKLQDKKENEIKTVYPINEDINYEDLEKTASYIISLKKEEKEEKEKETKEYKFNMRYIYGKYFRRDKIYN